MSHRFDDEENTALLEKLAELKQPKFLILNKIDIGPKREAARAHRQG